MSRKSIETYIANRNIDYEELDMSQLDEVTTQLAQVLEQLSLITQKQNEQEQVLAYLNKTEPEHIPVQQAPQQLTLDLFRIPDPIKSIPKFDGNRKQLVSWLKTVEDTLSFFEPMVQEQQMRIYWQAVQNKIEGKAKDILCLAGNPQTFVEIKQILTDALGDKQELSFYKSQLWATQQMDNMSIHAYYNKTKEILQSIKTLAKQNPIYNHSWMAISTFIEEDALAAFIAGLKKPYFGYAQAARPKNLEEAYAFLCKFSTNETISNNSKKMSEVKSYNQNRVPQKSEQSNFRRQQYPVIEKKPIGPAQDNTKMTPMEVDPSLRSRKTFNTRMINNHEIPENVEEPTNTNSENENFWEGQESDTED